MKRIACFLLGLMMLLCGCQAFGAEALPVSDSAYIDEQNMFIEKQSGKDFNRP